MQRAARVAGGAGSRAGFVLPIILMLVVLLTALPTAGLARSAPDLRIASAIVVSARTGASAASGPTDVTRCAGGRSARQQRAPLGGL
jgi:Tfp pilus assembly protein PilX